MPLKIVETERTPEDHYDVLDAALTDVFVAAGVEFVDDEALACLVSYNRLLKIALGVPVEVPS